jgi:hypothetical protein
VVVRVPARDYEDHTDSLSAARLAAAADLHLEPWQVSAAWEDDSRDTIVVSASIKPSRDVTVLRWGVETSDAEAWDPDALGSGDYRTERAYVLYAAVGSTVGDDEYRLCEARDGSGRWALLGYTAQGHRYAVEAP